MYYNSYVQRCCASVLCVDEMFALLSFMGRWMVHCQKRCSIAQERQGILVRSLLPCTVGSSTLFATLEVEAMGAKLLTDSYFLLDHVYCRIISSLFILDYAMSRVTLMTVNCVQR